MFEIAIILLLLLFNGIFAMSEIAVVSARTVRLQQMAQRGSPGATTALDLAESPNRFLSTVQVGITLVGIFAGAVGGANIAGELAVPLSDLPGIGRYAGTISLTIVVGVITFLSVVIGELVPKRIALSNAEKIAALVARPMRGLSIIATPIVHLLSSATDVTLKLLGIQSLANEEINEEEIRMMIHQSAEAGTIETAERDMVESIFRLDDRTLESIMTPRPEIIWLDINAPEPVNRHLIQRSHHSRFPVCDGDMDHILGVVQAKELLFSCLDGHPLNIQSKMEEPLLIPETMRVLHALERFKQSGQHMALLFDEYGGIEGMVTLIDLLQAIVGDIPTLEEMTEPLIVQRQDGSWLVDGLITVDVFKEAFALKKMPGESRFLTLGGFIVYMLGGIPKTGNYFRWSGFRFEVADMDGYRVDKVLMEAIPVEDEAASSDLEPPVG